MNRWQGKEPAALDNPQSAPDDSGTDALEPVLPLQPLLHQILRQICSAEAAALEAEWLSHAAERLAQEESIDPALLLQACQVALTATDQPAIEFLEAAGNRLRGTDALAPLIEAIDRQMIASRDISHYQAVSQLARLMTRLAADDATVLLKAIPFLLHTGSQDVLYSLELLDRCAQMPLSLTDRIIATTCTISARLKLTGQWQQAQADYERYKVAILELLQANPQLPALSEAISNLSTEGYFFFYFEDLPKINRSIRNQLAKLIQDHTRQRFSHQSTRYQQRSIHFSSQPEPLKIGYLSSCLRCHSVGWLSRWLLNYHDRQAFEIHLYASVQANDSVQQQLKSLYGDRFHSLSSNVSQIADRIHDDAIDILVDLDSITCFSGCDVTALKPAPIQVNWLGFDASGLPAVDYFIADPYVLPDDAQDYYSEKIWRLPQTYIAVDGFEVGIASLRRSDLDIPEDAIVYLSSQVGMKRNPDNIRLQMQILRAVPNSYFLIKSWGTEPALLQAFFAELAEQEGVSADRLRLLPSVASELTHRANLSLADVVLDTFPYNGATTTLEALWMGLPIVTRVGQQFAARNSYTMLKNVGIQEGIAWSDEEYLEWGIRLGQDAPLRQRIAYRLRQSRHTAPLWNTQQFARQMEQAYQQMWKIYVGG